MGVIFDKPPIWDAAQKLFGFKDKSLIVFAWNENIYNPNHCIVDPHLYAHEEIHFVQQKKIGGSKPWWDKYLVDPKFRLEQELEAYRAQYTFYCVKYKDRNARNSFLNKIAYDLSEIYKCDITHSEAKKQIKGV